MKKYFGVVLVLSGALTWAFGQVLAKPISENIKGQTLTAWIGVIGGPPCPDFSVAGTNKGSFGDNGKLTGLYFDQILKKFLPFS